MRRLHQQVRLLRPVSLPSSCVASLSSLRAMSSGGSVASKATSTDVWDPTQYEKFSDHRTRPGLDLLHAIPRTPASGQAIKTVYDLGCGAGRFVPSLADAFPTATITGVDSSANMLTSANGIISKSRPDLSKRVTWTEQSIDQFKGPTGGADVIYSNAALQWLPNHDVLFPHLMKQLRSGGSLAVQMPSNWNQPSHTLLYDTCTETKWSAGVDRYMAEKPRTQKSMAEYYSLLRPLSIYVDIWKIEYQHVLPATSNTTVSGAASHPVYEWVKGTSMAPILAALPTRESKIAFETSYINKLNTAYPLQPADAQHKHPWALFPFHRLFIIAVAK